MDDGKDSIQTYLDDERRSAKSRVLHGIEGRYSDEFI